MQLTVDGLVLRAFKSGDDRVLRLMTRELGVITAFANRANAPRSKLAPYTEPLCFSNFVLFHNRDRYVVDRADSNRLFFGLRSDYEKMCLASYFAQLCLELCPPGEPVDEQLPLLLNTLHFLEEGLRERSQLKPLFELRLLTLSGFMPDLTACASCGTVEAPIMRFYPVDGQLLCNTCYAESFPTGSIPIAPGVLAAMRHIIYSPPEKLFSFAVTGPALTTLGRVSERYLLAQVERVFPALEMYRKASLDG